MTPNIRRQSCCQSFPADDMAMLHGETVGRCRRRGRRERNRITTKERSERGRTKKTLDRGCGTVACRPAAGVCDRARGDKHKRRCGRRAACVCRLLVYRPREARTRPSLRSSPFTSFLRCDLRCLRACLNPAQTRGGAGEGCAGRISSYRTQHRVVATDPPRCVCRSCYPRDPD